MIHSKNITKPPRRIWLDDDDHASALTAGLRLWASKGMSEARIVLDSPCLVITDQLPPPARKPRRPTLASVAKQASTAGIDVARYEVKPDGAIIIITGKPEPAEPENPWLAELRKRKDIKK